MNEKTYSHIQEKKTENKQKCRRFIVIVNVVAAAAAIIIVIIYYHYDSGREHCAKHSTSAQ